MCLFLVLYGLLNDKAVASRAAHPVDSWLLGLGRAMDELKKLSTAKREGKSRGHDASGNATDPSKDLP